MRLKNRKYILKNKVQLNNGKINLKKKGKDEKLDMGKLAVGVCTKVELKAGKLKIEVGTAGV